MRSPEQSDRRQHLRTSGCRDGAQPEPSRASFAWWLHEGTLSFSENPAPDRPGTQPLRPLPPQRRGSSCEHTPAPHCAGLSRLSDSVLRLLRGPRVPRRAQISQHRSAPTPLRFPLSSRHSTLYRTRHTPSHIPSSALCGYRSCPQLRVPFPFSQSC